MTLNDILHVDSCFLLQVVDVLSHVHPKNSFVMKHLGEEVCRSCLETIHIERLRELIESFWFLPEEIDFEQTFRLWKIVLS